MVALHSVNSWFVSVVDFVLYFEVRLVYIQKVDCIITNKQKRKNNLHIKRPWK